jgi:TonB family protein
LIHFDFEDRYQDEQIVGTAISRREAVLMSVVFHSLLAVTLLLAPRIPFVQALLERSPEEMAALQARQRHQPQENRTFVFVQPRVDIEAPKPPPRAEASDKDRVAQTVERAPNPTNTLPFSRGNSSNRVEASEIERPRGPEAPTPPSPGEVAQAQPRPDTMRQLPAADAGLTIPREETSQAPNGSGALGEALRNLQKYVQQESLNNPGGGDTSKFGPFIQFDTKGVEFGPWIRRFVAQVKRNWFIPYAAMTMRGHVVLQFNVHKDGRITDVNVVGPSGVDAFNNAAANAIVTSNPTEPLPPEYPSDKAFFTVTFYYNEEPAGQ